MDWTYKGAVISSHNDLHPNCTDFVYLITYADGKKYIGKKAVRANRRKPPLKGKKRNRIVFSDLPFKNYKGSHNTETQEILSKEILYQCSSRKSATYVETAILFEWDAIFLDEFVNENILGKFYKNDCDGVLNDN